MSAAVLAFLLFSSAAFAIACLAIVNVPTFVALDLSGAAAFVTIANSHEMPDATAFFAQDNGRNMCAC